MMKIGKFLDEGYIEMEKLIDLLSRGAKNDDWCLVRIEGNVRKFDERLIISKSYGFIKRLVDNDKIDRNKIYWLDIGYKIDEIGIGERKNTVDIDLSNKLLMLLAIQDKPIDFLIEILK